MSVLPGDVASRASILLTAQRWEVGSAAVFRSPKDEFGCLSNSAVAFPLVIDGTTIGTSEALYQAMKFPSHPEVQMAVLTAATPYEAKAIAREHEADFARPDWLDVRLDVMLGTAIEPVLRSTGMRPIVERSRHDQFWGADGDDHVVEGVNALGQLLDASPIGDSVDGWPALRCPTRGPSRP